MKILYIIALGAIFSFTAKADDFKSEAFYKADAGQTYIEGGLTYATFSAEREVLGVNIDVDSDNTDLNFRLEHGYSDFVSFYFGSGHGSSDTEVKSSLSSSDSKNSGISPLNIGARFQHNTNTGHIISELDIDYNFEKEDCNSAGDDCNAQDGSTNASLMLGYIWNLENSHLGLQVNLDIIATDTEAEDGTKADQDKGHTISAFYESKLSEKAIGFASISHVDVGGSDDTTFLNLLIGGRYETSQKLHILGGITYSDVKSDVFESGNSYGLLAGARYHF